MLRAGGTHEDWDCSAAEATVGILVFDIEHREMLDHLRLLYEGLAQGRSERRLRQALTRLIAVTKRHCAHEEEYMRMLDYAAYRQHADDHAALSARLQKFMDELFADDASAERNLAAVRAFFGKWLLDHILEHDRSLANFLGQKGIR
jgi:hemerythrin-like metal-binding protein